MKFGSTYKNILLILSLALIFLSMPLLKKKKEDNRYNQIVRLVSHDGKTYCSGFVVSDEIVITAAHCINSSIVFIQDENKKIIVKSIVYSLIKANDQAILVGDFTMFKKFNVKDVLDGINKNDKNLKTCGYPYGGKLICYNYTNKGNYNFMLRGISQLYSGMSGGPLFDSKTNIVIGINFGVIKEYALHSPLVNTWSLHGLE